MQASLHSPLDGTDDAALLQPTRFIESTAPEVVRFARETVGDARDDVQRGVMLYYAVRDEFRYDPYRITLDETCFRATTVLREGAAFCIPKAILLAAAARAVGIPAALGFADVKNHLTTQKLLDAIGTDLFIYHGYTLLKLDGRWVKATPAFNLSLCERFGVKPLEFDGRSDALLHPFDAQNRKHMEYVNDRGVYADFPFQEIASSFRRFYARYFEQDLHDGRAFEDESPLTS
ncbi:MAG TPA: transglutaminase family protein [bacterium]|nr:transglutaminase family protein [bacterium]